MSALLEVPLLEVNDLKKHFPIYRGVFSKVSGHVYAVDGVSFTIAKGETLENTPLYIGKCFFSPSTSSSGAVVMTRSSKR